MKTYPSLIMSFSKFCSLLAIVSGISFTQVKSQCTNYSFAGDIRYGIRITDTTVVPIQYGAYANPTGTGCQLIGNSQFSLVVSDGATINIVNPNSSGVPGFTWANNTNVIFNGFKYAAVATSGSTSGAIPFNANSETPLFTFTITGTCTAGVRIFSNASDPGSAVLNGSDFRNTFYTVVPNSQETYTANVTATLPCPGVALPLTLSNFAARAVNNKQVLLNWETVNETNTRQFIVERSSKAVSANNVDWQAVGALAAAGTVTGSRTYQLTDNQPLNGVSYYRLRTTDVDGRITYSDVKQVSFNIRTLLASAVYPNPVERGGAVNLTTTETVRYRLLDKAGRLIAAGTFASGNNRVKAPTASGTYVLEVTGTQNDSNKEHHRIIVQ